MIGKTTRIRMGQSMIGKTTAGELREALAAFADWEEVVIEREAQNSDIAHRYRIVRISAAYEGPRCRIWVEAVTDPIRPWTK